MSEIVIVEQNIIDEAVIPETPSALGTQQIFVLVSPPTITVDAEFSINTEGHLIVTYSDLTTRDLGQVVGRDGVDGQDGNIVDVVEDTTSQAINVSVASNKMYTFLNNPASSVVINIPDTFVVGSFCEVDFVAGNAIAANGITINNAQGNPDVAIVEFGISMGVSEWHPEAGKQVSLLICNNGLNIVCGVVEV